MTASQDPAKRKALEHVFAHLEKQFGEGTIMTLGKHSKRKKVSICLLYTSPSPRD